MIYPRFSSDESPDLRFCIGPDFLRKLRSDIAADGASKPSLQFDWSTNLPSVPKTTTSPDATGVHAVVNFLGMSDYRAYEQFGRRIYDLKIPGVRGVYEEAAAGLGISSIDELLNVRFSAENYLTFKVAFTAHSLAQLIHTKELFAKQGVELRIEAYSGVSAGAATAAIAADALSMTHYVSYLKLVTEIQRLQQMERKLVSITLTGDALSEKLDRLRSNFPALEVTKISSPKVAAIYLPNSEAGEFARYCQAIYGDKLTIEKVRSFPVATHSKCLAPYLDEIRRRISDSGIEFRAPSIPILCSGPNGYLRTAKDIRESMLDILAEPIDGKAFSERIAAIEPSIVIEIGSGCNLQNLFKLNETRIPIELVDEDKKVVSIQGQYARRRVKVRDADLNLDSINTANASIVPPEHFLTNKSALTLLQRIRWSIAHRTDVIYGFSKHAEINRVEPNMRQRIEEVIHGDRFLRNSALRLLEAPGLPGHYRIPFGNSRASNQELGWTTFGRSISRPITLSDGKKWSLVFKGAGTQEDPASPIEIAPNRMDYLPVPNRKPLEPHPSWVLQGGESLHTTKNEIINSYGLRAVYSLFGETAQTAIPLGAFKIHEIPIRVEGKISAISSCEYFLGRFDRLSMPDRVRFMRYLRIDMEETLSYLEQARIESALKTSDPAIVRAVVSDLLRTWTPVVYGYLVEGDVNARIEKWDLRPSPFRLDRQGITKRQILEAYGVDSTQEASLETKLEIAHAFAKSLSRAALYHRMGGDFGSKRASLTPKDVTVSGAILDLHANMLAGAGGGAYRWGIHSIKQLWNLRNARETVTCFARALELSDGQVLETVQLFNHHYKLNLGRKPSFDQVYRSPFL